MSFPAVLNEAISVTGTYPFLYTPSANTPPTDPALTSLGRFRGPVLVFGNFVNDIGTVADTGAPVARRPAPGGRLRRLQFGAPGGAGRGALFAIRPPRPAG